MPSPEATDGRTSSNLLYTAAKLYYLQDATQAQIADKLGTSRATVSRLLSEARSRGIVQIEVVPPSDVDHEELAARLRDGLGLTEVFLSDPVRDLGTRRLPRSSSEELMGAALAPAVGDALERVGLQPGDVLLVSSGRTMYEVGRASLPQLPGVLVAPTVGGNDHPEGWFQTNEITRLVAMGIGGRAVYLFAPAMPGPNLHRSLRKDPAIQRVLHLWSEARCMITGIGAPPMLRSVLPDYVPRRSTALRSAVGDICSRFFDRDGRPIQWEGGDQLFALEFDELATIDTRIAVAVGEEKVTPIVVAARAGLYNQLVTDPATAELILAAL